MNQIIELILSNVQYHSRNSNFYHKLDHDIKNLILKSNFSLPNIVPQSILPFEKLKFPYIEMGTINSLDLFGLDELIIFAYYWINRRRYKKVADIGANIGLHSLIMNKCGWDVTAYEPDPDHVKILKNTLKNNNMVSTTIIECAVSDTESTKTFIRVLGNTTGSHLEGAKKNPYGELKTFQVKTIKIDDIFIGNDLIKMDVEGEEFKILQSTTAHNWKDTDMILEVGSSENAKKIFHHCNKINVNMFSQKNNWNKVSNFRDMPESYKDGSLFISLKDEMTWFE